MAGPQNTQFAVAIHVLVYLAGVGSELPVSSEELAGSVNVSSVHIRRVLGPLRDAGLVTSRPGTGGGWELAADPAGIRLDHVWRLVSVAPALASHGPNPACETGRQVQAVVDRLESEVSEAIAATLHARCVTDLLVEFAGTP